MVTYTALKDVPERYRERLADDGVIEGVNVDALDDMADDAERFISAVPFNKDAVYVGGPTHILTTERLLTVQKMWFVNRADEIRIADIERVKHVKPPFGYGRLTVYGTGFKEGHQFPSGDLVAFADAIRAVIKWHNE
jgi:hypothetical protein